MADYYYRDLGYDSIPKTTHIVPVSNESTDEAYKTTLKDISETILYSCAKVVTDTATSFDNIPTKIIFDKILFDYNDEWDDVSSVFQPKETGYYFFNYVVVFYLNSGTPSSAPYNVRIKARRFGSGLTEFHKRYYFYNTSDYEGLVSITDSVTCKLEFSDTLSIWGEGPLGLTWRTDPLNTNLSIVKTNNF